MVKAIFATPFIRRAATAVMLTSTVVASNAYNLNREHSSEKTILAEVVSKEESIALSTRATNLNYNRMAHNKKVDKKYSEIYPLNNEKKYYLAEKYNKYGIYGASIVLQREIDEFYLNNTFSEYLNCNYLNQNELKGLHIFLNDFKEWREKEYSIKFDEALNALINGNQKADAEDCIALLDNFVEKSPLFILNAKDIYRQRSQRFVSKQKNADTEQAKSDLIAYKTHIINSLAYTIYIYENRDNPFYYGLNSFMQEDFVDGEASIKP